MRVTESLVSLMVEDVTCRDRGQNCQLTRHNQISYPSAYDQPATPSTAGARLSRIDYACPTPSLSRVIESSGKSRIMQGHKPGDQSPG